MSGKPDSNIRLPELAFDSPAMGDTLLPVRRRNSHESNTILPPGALGDTEYRLPGRGSSYVTGPTGDRVRGHYVTLSDAIADDSLPDFHPQHLYTHENPNNDPATLTPNYNPNKNNATFTHDRSGGGDGDGKGEESTYEYATYRDYTEGGYPSSPGYLQHGSPGVTSGLLQTPQPPSLFPGGLPKPPRRHPFSNSFEAPKFKTLVVHTLLSLLAYPFLFAFVALAKNRSLFWCRLLVGAGCGITGFILDLSLLSLGRRHLEAAAWATVIHQSKHHDSPGVPLKDIAPLTEDPASAWSGFLLLWNRNLYPGAARKNRVQYDRRPWSIHILFFLIIVTICSFLPFIFGRIIDITTRVANQYDSYYEHPIKGDISESDLARAVELQGPFNNFRLTWTIAPYSTHGSLPPAVNFRWPNNQNTGYDTVFFSETTRSQLQSNGSGFGTFETELLSSESNARMSDDEKAVTASLVLPTGVSPGNIIRHPKYGIRIKCERIPDPQTNILPISSILSMTYLFVPKDVVQRLVDYFGKPFPDDFLEPTMVAGDSPWPDNVDPSKTLAAANFYNNGVNHAYWSKPLYKMGVDGTGFVSLEAVLVRLNTTYAPNGTFPVYSEPLPDITGNITRIGYDAAICIEVFEPWVVEVYNSTVGAPTSLKIVEKGNQVRSANLDGNNREEKVMRNGILDVENWKNGNLTRSLNSTRIPVVYDVAHGNSINQVLKDNGRDSFYVPSTIGVSYSNGQGAYGYTSLSINHFEKAKALADANNILPYFSGSGDLISRVFPDKVLAQARIHPIYISICLGTVWLLGVIAALFVPRLPLNVPRRGFELYSWVAAFYADELVGVGKGSGGKGDDVYLPGVHGPSQVGLPIGRRMAIEEIEHNLGDVRFRYVS